MFNARLLNVSKPARYIGGELNTVLEKNSDCLDFCLIFPDIYEIGSSHVGFRLLYDIVNRSESVYCRRFFAPWPDALDLLKTDAFISLEDKKPLKEFDVLGFSLQYEMCYTTVLAIIKNSGIALKSAERGEDAPIITAGGSCTYNPAPLSTFIDAFYIGEGDEHLTQILEGIKVLKDKGALRREILEYINGFPFMYVPLVDADKIVKRDIYKNFSSSEGCRMPFVPLMPAIQDRVAVEIARGCTAGCRFCQAGVIYRPVRERSSQLIVKDACCQLEATGHLEVSLLSLSTGDYSQLEPLVKELNSRINHMHVSLSTPSLRADSVSGELFKEISKVRKSGFTIAPEAGTERMRRIINKNLTEDDIIGAVKAAAENGYNGVKLYFMIGLPFETDEDILSIALLASKIKSAVRRNGFDITISVSHFVPKPHTPFQRFGQVEKGELERRMYMLKDELKRRRFKFKFHDTRMSVMESVMSRGNRDVTKLLEYAADNNFYLDSWDDFFNYEKWHAAFEAVGMDLISYASKGYSEDEKTPWWNIDTGVKESFLQSELQKAKDEVSTGDCRRDACYACGVCDFTTLQPVKAPEFLNSEYIIDESQKDYQKYELTYEKKEGAKFLSALELARVFSLSLRAAGADLKFSQGFNPMPRIVMYLPLPVGIGGENEKLLFEGIIPECGVFLKKLSDKLPEGLNVKSIGTADSMKIGAAYISVYHLEGRSKDDFEKAFAEKDMCYTKTAKNGSVKTVEISKFMMNYYNGRLTLKADEDGGFNLLELFKKRGIKAEDTEIKRISVETA